MTPEPTASAAGDAARTLRARLGGAAGPDSATADAVRLVHGTLPRQARDGSPRSGGLPAPGDPAPADPAPGGPAPADPAPADPAPADPAPADPAPGDPAPADAETLLAALELLRELRGRLSEWEPQLIEAARGAGVSWARLAPALGVASRQAAERRYLRLRPAAPGDANATGDQRVRNERNRRAADRAVTDWARRHAVTLRRTSQVRERADGGFQD